MYVDVIDVEFISNSSIHTYHRISDIGMEPSYMETGKVLDANVIHEGEYSDQGLGIKVFILGFCSYL